MSLDLEITPALLDRYVTGECTPEQVDAIRSWLASAPENEAQLKQIRTIRETAATTPVWDVQGMWRDVAGEVEAYGNVPMDKPAVGALPRAPGGESNRINPIQGRMGAPLPLIYTSRRYLGIAAVIAIVIIAFRYVVPSNSNTPEAQTYSTAPAQRASITLADGSVMTLAPATTARVAGRNVDLTGEAVFQVTQHSRTPFTVKTGNTTTRVLGTRFGVRAYTDESSVRVAVENGRVSVGSSNISAGEVAIIRGNTSTITREAEVAKMLSWTTGRLVFSGDSLAVVARELSRWYNIQINLESDRIAVMPVTTAITSEPASIAIPAIAEAAGLVVSREGSIYTIRGNTR